MSEEKITRNLIVPLSDEDKVELGNQLADLNINIESKMDWKKALPKQIESLQEEAAEIAHKLKTGTKQSEIECYYAEDDPEPGKRQLYRIDTSEKVGEPEDMPDPSLFEGQVQPNAEIPANPEEEEEFEPEETEE